MSKSNATSQRDENWTSIHAFVPRDIAIWIRHNNYLRLAIVRRSAARDVEQWGRRYNIATMSDVNCIVSDETLQYWHVYVLWLGYSTNDLVTRHRHETMLNIKVMTSQRDSTNPATRYIEPRICHTWNDVILVNPRVVARGPMDPGVVFFSAKQMFVHAFNSPTPSTFLSLLDLWRAVTRLALSCSVHTNISFWGPLDPARPDSFA